jgi:hypothetical protein
MSHGRLSIAPVAQDRLVLLVVLDLQGFCLPPKEGMILQLFCSVGMTAGIKNSRAAHEHELSTSVFGLKTAGRYPS